MRLRHHFQGQKVKGQVHQAALLSAPFTRKAAAVVSVGTYSAWESTATLRLLGGAPGARALTGRRGAGAYCVATHTACYFSALFFPAGGVVDCRGTERLREL